MLAQAIVVPVEGVLSCKRTFCLARLHPSRDGARERGRNSCGFGGAERALAFRTGNAVVPREVWPGHPSKRSSYLALSEAAYILDDMETEPASNVLSEMEYEQAGTLASKMVVDSAASALAELEYETAACILSEMDSEAAANILSEMDAEPQHNNGALTPWSH